MDPLSVTASILTVVGAASKVSKGLKLLKALREAPGELSNLLEEVERIEMILKCVEQSFVASERAVPELERVIDAAKEKLLALDSLIQYSLTKADEKSKVDYWQWLRKQGSADRMRQDLATLRLDLTALISVTSL